MHRFVGLLDWAIFDEKDRIRNKTWMVTFNNTVNSGVTIEIADGRRENFRTCFSKASCNDISPVLDTRRKFVRKIIMFGGTTGKTIRIGNRWTESCKRWEVDVVTASMTSKIIIPASKFGPVGGTCKSRDVGSKGLIKF